MADAADAVKKGASGIVGFFRKAALPMAGLASVFFVASFFIDGGLSAQTLATVESSNGIGGPWAIIKEGGVELFGKITGLFSGGPA